MVQELEQVLEKYLTESKEDDMAGMIPKYNVTINWKGELHPFKEIKASSAAQATSVCVAVLVKRLGLSTSAPIYRNIKQNPNSIKVEKI